MVIVFSMINCGNDSTDGGNSTEYGIKLSPAANKNFGSVQAGYDDQQQYQITITNTGTEPTGVLTVALSGTNAAGFTLSTLSIDSIPVGEEDSFFVWPKTGLPEGSYSAKVDVNGSNGLSASFNVSFTVIAGDSIIDDPEDDDPFISEEQFQFEVTVPANGTFAIPLSGRLSDTWNKAYNWNINWGDGSTETIANTGTEAGTPRNGSTSGGIPHTYTNAGIYTITIVPVNSDEAWFSAFGFYANQIGANRQANRDMLTKIISPISPKMTRTQTQITGTPPIYEWANTFNGCANLTMGDNFSFSDEWQSIAAVGDKFASGMFFNCCSDNFTMNEVFNLPRGITTAGHEFASAMFIGCSGSSFTMNGVFNLPQGITNTGDDFGNQMFSSCSGNAFKMNGVFNLPQQITTVGTGFAFYMFYGCSGNDFTMSDDFNLPEKITAIGDNFAYGMFYECSGNAFKMNDVFNLPEKITAIGDGFAYFMFYKCSGNTFTMNGVFNLPPEITEVGAHFAEYMFYSCNGIIFDMNDVFNLPQGIAIVGDGFAGGMFQGCYGSAFKMNDVFNLPQGITTVGEKFAYYMFHFCMGNSFMVNNKFKFPLLDSTNIDKIGVFESTFDNLNGSGILNAPAQIRTAADIINMNPLPSENKKTFRNSTCFSDFDDIDAKWK